MERKKSRQGNKLSMKIAMALPSLLSGPQRKSDELNRDRFRHVALRGWKRNYREEREIAEDFLKMR